MFKHKEFILTPISSIVREVVFANSGIGMGVETHPLSEYVLQSLFLKMTGSQEQKMKCICWELATNDYEYRYDRFTLRRLGECSTYNEKNIVYKDIVTLIKKHRPKFISTSSLDKSRIQQQAISDISTFCHNSPLATWFEPDFVAFASAINLLPLNQFVTGDNLFESVLIEKYELLYTHRNRCAHNTQSYQENLPTLKTLFAKDRQYDNYFVRFTLLNLIDLIFIKLYEIYLEAVEEN